MKKRIIVGLAVLSFIILSSPLLFRSLEGNDSIIGQESYFHLGIAQNVHSPQNYPLPNVLPNAFHHLLASLLLLGHPAIVAKALPLVLGMINVCLLFAVLRRYGADIVTAAVAGVIMSTCSLFISLHSILQPFILLLTFGLLSALVFSYSPRWSVPVIVLAISVDIVGFLVICAGMSILALQRSAIRTVLIALLIGIVLAGSIWFAYGFVAINTFFQTNNLASFINTFGLGFGFSLFTIILSIIGIIAFWSKKHRQNIGIIIGSGMLLFSFFEPVARAIILPFMVFFAAKGIIFLASRTWSVQSLRTLTLFLICLSILFTTVMTINGLVNAEPTLGKINAMNFLKTSDSDDVILSSAENGILIQRIAGRKAFLDQVTLTNITSSYANDIFYSVRVKDAEVLLKQFNITHILVDEKMIDGGVWSGNEQGILFVAKHSQRFVNVYEKDGILVYKFIY